MEYTVTSRRPSTEEEPVQQPHPSVASPTKTTISSNNNNNNNSIGEDEATPKAGSKSTNVPSADTTLWHMRASSQQRLEEILQAYPDTSSSGGSHTLPNSSSAISAGSSLLLASPQQTSTDNNLPNGRAKLLPRIDTEEEEENMTSNGSIKNDKFGNNQENAAPMDASAAEVQEADSTKNQSSEGKDAGRLDDEPAATPANGNNNNSNSTTLTTTKASTINTPTQSFLVRQRWIGEFLAQQEEGIFSLLQSMEQRQFDLRQLMGQQQQVSFALIQMCKDSMVPGADKKEQSQLKNAIQAQQPLLKQIRKQSATTAASTFADDDTTQDFSSAAPTTGMSQDEQDDEKGVIVMGGKGEADDNDDSFHVVIVGAGMAGLVCARTLLDYNARNNNNINLRVTLLEAHGQVGGRIQPNCDFCPGYPLDIGAEYIHGTDTILTDTIQELANANLLQPHPKVVEYRRRQEEKRREQPNPKTPQQKQQFRQQQLLLQGEQESEDSIEVFNMDDMPKPPTHTTGPGGPKNTIKAKNHVGNYRNVTGHSNATPFSLGLGSSFGDDGDDENEFPASSIDSRLPSFHEESTHQNSKSTSTRKQPSYGLPNSLHSKGMMGSSAPNSVNNYRNLYQKDEESTVASSQQQQKASTSYGLDGLDDSFQTGEISSVTGSFYGESDAESMMNGGTGHKRSSSGNGDNLLGQSSFSANEDDSLMDFTAADFSRHRAQPVGSKPPTSNNHQSDEPPSLIPLRNPPNDQEDPSESRTIVDEDFWEEIFITAHADGGPDEAPTPKHGMYGMYYAKGKLRKAHDDSYTKPLVLAIERMLQKGLAQAEKGSKTSHELSIHDGLVEQMEQLLQEGVLSSVQDMEELYKLAVAGYGNTATITDLNELSLTMLALFEEHWEKKEAHGDFRLPKDLGMFSVAQGLQTYLETQYGSKDGRDARFQLLVKAPVERIVEAEGGGDSPETKKVTVTYSHFDENESVSIEADQAVVAVPPPILPRILPNLSRDKRDALKYVAFNSICKVILKFSRCFWPPKLQSIVSAEGLFPELWFRSDFGEPGQESKSHLAIFYMSDDYADSFVEDCLVENMAAESNFTWDKSRASDLCLQHLATVLEYDNEDPDELRHLLVDVFIHDWSSHPYVEGGHFAPRTGMTPEHLKSLAAPMGSIYFCGEATNTDACGTIQAAMETGVRAAEEVAKQQELDREARLKKRLQERDEEEKLHNSFFDEQMQREAELLQDEMQDQADVDTVPMANAVAESPSGSSGKTSGPLPERLSELVERQETISQALAKQEEDAFNLIHSMEGRQMEVSRALVEQDMSSLEMIQTVDQMTSKVQGYEEQLERVTHELQITSQEKEKVLRTHWEQMDRFKELQLQWDSLYLTMEKRDASLLEKEAEIERLKLAMEEVRQGAGGSSMNEKEELRTSKRLVTDIESIIQLMDLKVKTVQEEIAKAKSETKAANSKVKERDATIKSMSLEMEELKERIRAMEADTAASSTASSVGQGRQESGKSPSHQMRQVKAAREQKLQQLMKRMRIGGGNRGRPSSARQDSSHGSVPGSDDSYTQFAEHHDNPNRHHPPQSMGQAACIKHAFLGGGRSNRHNHDSEGSSGRKGSHHRRGQQHPETTSSDGSPKGSSSKSG